MDRLRDKQDSISRSNTSHQSSLRRGESENGEEETPEKMTAENFPQLGKDTNPCQTCRNKNTQ